LIPKELILALRNETDAILKEPETERTGLKKYTGNEPRERQPVGDPASGEESVQIPTGWDVSAQDRALRASLAKDIISR
jgi:hypothetical protein